MGANQDKLIQNGNIDYDQADRLSKDYNLSIASVEELKRKYLMYRVKNGSKIGINIHNYVVFFREYVNPNASEMEIYKSFNAFDSKRNGSLNFIQLITAISCKFYNFK
jgi:Ca2+-binding EF-hand superfamily protein